jgi:hypothetical protein
VTYAAGKGHETCSSPKPCCQPAEVEIKHALVNDQDEIYAIVPLGYCLEHGMGEQT